MHLRFKHAPPGGRLPAKLHDPPALEGSPGAFSLLHDLTVRIFDCSSHQLTWFSHFWVHHRSCMKYYRHLSHIHWCLSSSLFSWFGMGVLCWVRRRPYLPRTLYWNEWSGDKSNHIPSLHIPQVYYFLAFATLFGWPALISGDGGVFSLLCEVRARMFGGKRSVVTCKLWRQGTQLAV